MQGVLKLRQGAGVKGTKGCSARRCGCLIDILLYEHLIP